MENHIQLAIGRLVLFLTSYGSGKEKKKLNPVYAPGFGNKP